MCVYSFWENSADAEKYDCTTLPILTKVLRGVVDGPLRVHTFGGSHGRFSGSLVQGAGSMVKNWLLQEEEQQLTVEHSVSRDNEDPYRRVPVRLTRQISPPPGP